MDTGIESEKKESDKDKKKPKYKLMKAKFKNYLLNLISYILNNKNNFEEKLNPSDLEIILESNSELSTFYHFKYKTKISYASFNPKRDLMKNIKLYKQIPSQIELNDEYYSDDIDYVNVDMHPQMQKGLKLDLSEFPFYSYENKIIKKIDKSILKDKLKCNDNEFIFCIYVSIYDSKDKENPIVIVENMMELDLFWKYFKYVFIIFQVETEKKIKKLSEDEKIKKYLNYNNDSSDANSKNKICILFNLLSNYKENNKNCNENLVNIFQENRKFVLSFDYEKNYFFILDNNEKIVEINIFSVVWKTITFLLMELKKHDENNEKLSYFSKNELDIKNQIKNAKKLIDFIVNINKRKIDYIFDIKFGFSLVFAPNDELTKIKLKNINYIKINGEFHKKECNYLKSCSNSINIPRCEFSIKEIPTIDIEIDFNNMECEKCKKIISEDSFLYYCFICKIKYCYECVETHMKNNSGRKRYIDPKHNLIFFKTRDKNQFLNLDKDKIGNNQFVNYNDNELTYWSSTRCNGCEDAFRKEFARYICLSCKKGKQSRNGFIDYCGDCIEKMCKNKKDMENLEKKADELFTGFNNDFFEDYEFKIEHRHEKHVYLMMPYQVDGYYSF